MGERVFIGAKSSGHPVLRAYVWYYSTVVQRLFHTTKYYLVDSMNSVMYVRYFGVRLLYCSQSTVVLFVRANVWWGTIICPR
jgi:hypothetical protein